MDITSISVFGFSLFRIILWLLFLVFLWATARKIIIDQKNDDRSLEAILWSYKWRIFLTVILFFGAMFYTQNEAPYRPKTTITKTDPLLEERLREIDSAEPPVIGPAQGDLRDAENDDYSERNAAENAEARKKFEELAPD